MKKVLKSVPTKWISVILLIALACVLVYTITLRSQASAMGGDLGETAGTAVGKAVGSLEGITKGREEGIAEGTEKGLSAEDSLLESARNAAEIQVEALVKGVSLYEAIEITFREKEAA